MENQPTLNMIKCQNEDVKTGDSTIKRGLARDKERNGKDLRSALIKNPRATSWEARPTEVGNGLSSGIHSRSLDDRTGQPG